MILNEKDLKQILAEHFNVSQKDIRISTFIRPGVYDKREFEIPATVKVEINNKDAGVAERHTQGTFVLADFKREPYIGNSISEDG